MVDSEIATLRAQNGGAVGSSRGRREVLVEPYRELGTLNTITTFSMGFEMEINAWAETNVDASRRNDNDSREMQKELTNDGVKECVAEPKNRKAAGAEGIAKGFLNWGVDDGHDGSAVQLDLETQVQTQETERRNSSQPFYKQETRLAREIRQ